MALTPFRDTDKRLPRADTLGLCLHPLSGSGFRWKRPPFGALRQVPPSLDLPALWRALRRSRPFMIRTSVCPAPMPFALFSSPVWQRLSLERAAVRGALRQAPHPLALPALWRALRRSRPFVIRTSVCPAPMPFSLFSSPVRQRPSLEGPPFGGHCDRLPIPWACLRFGGPCGAHVLS